MFLFLWGPVGTCGDLCVPRQNVSGKHGHHAWRENVLEVCVFCVLGGGVLICRLVELQPNSSLILVKVIPGQPQEANCVSARSDQTVVGQQVLQAAGGARVDAAAAADARTNIGYLSGLHPHSTLEMKSSAQSRVLSCASTVIGCYGVKQPWQGGGWRFLCQLLQLSPGAPSCAPGDASVHDCSHACVWRFGLMHLLLFGEFS